MLDNGNLILVIDNALQTITQIAGKHACAFLPQGIGYPKCRFQSVSNPQLGSFGNHLLDQPIYQFDIFAKVITDATTVQKAVANKFHGQILTLTGQQGVSCRVVDSSKLLSEGQLPDSLVYHAIVLIEFRVAS